MFFYSTTDEPDSADFSLDYMSYPSDLCSNILFVGIFVICWLIIHIMHIYFFLYELDELDKFLPQQL